MQINTRN